MKTGVKEYLREIGRRGGQAGGESKVRGGAGYYRELGLKSARARKARHRRRKGKT